MIYDSSMRAQVKILVKSLVLTTIVNAKFIANIDIK